MIECTYCKDNKCGLREILSCKHRELMEENKNLTRKVEDEMEENFKLLDILKKVMKPIDAIDLDKTKDPSALGVACIEAVKEAQRVYIEAIINEELPA